MASDEDQGMTITTAVIVNVLVAGGIIGALALVVRLAHRIPDTVHAETLHPSQPLELELLRPQDEHAQLARAA
jgi:hypothetical protein